MVIGAATGGYDAGVGGCAMAVGAGGIDCTGGGVIGYWEAAPGTDAASASMKSVAVSGRRAASFARPASSGCSTDAGRLGLNFRGGGGGVSCYAAMTLSGFVPLKGTRPVAIS